MLSDLQNDYVKSYLRFYKFPKYGKEYIQEFGLVDFCQEFRQEHPNKKDYKYIINPLICGHKQCSQEHFDFPDKVFIDIDLNYDPGGNVEKFTQDTGCSPEGFVEKLKDDEHVMVAGLTTNLGIRIIVAVYHKYLTAEKLPNDYAGNEPGATEYLLTSIHKSNVKLVLNYFKEKYGLDTRIEREDVNTYVDPCINSFNQATYPVWEKHSFFNLNFRVFDNDNVEKDINRYIPITCAFQESVMDESVLDGIFQQNKKELKKIFDHRDDYTVIASAKGLLLQGKLQVLHILYCAYKEYYEGKSIPLNTEAEFIRYIGKQKPKFVIPIEHLFRKYGLVIPELNIKKDYFDPTMDCFFNKYDLTLKFDEYISEQRDALVNIISQHIKIVLRASAGTGKTTFIINYLYQLKQQFPQLVIVYAASKNLILNQIANEEDYKHIRFSKNYDKKTKPGGDIELSSFSSLKNINQRLGLVDILVLDEIHNLTTYALLNEEPYIIPEHRQCILISATPEPYLIGEKDYFYLNLVQNNEVKPKLKKFYTANMEHEVLKRLKTGRNTLIFLNDKKRGQALQKKVLDMGIPCYLINSDTKFTEEYIKLIYKQELVEGVVICTEVMNEGINIKNDCWDDILILDNYTCWIFTYYQLSKRFRKIKDVNIELYMRPHYFREKDDDETRQQKKKIRKDTKAIKQKAETENSNLSEKEIKKVVATEIVKYFNENNIKREKPAPFLSIDANMFREQFTDLNRYYDELMVKYTAVVDQINNQPDYQVQSSIFNDHLYYRIKDKYYINTNTVKYQIYTRFVKMASYYFEIDTLYFSYYFDVYVKWMSGSAEFKNIDRKELIQLIKDNINEFIWCQDCVSDEMADSMGIPQEIYQVYCDEKKYINLIIERYDWLKKVAGEDLVFDDLFKKRNRWLTFAEKVSKKYVSTTDHQLLDKTDLQKKKEHDIVVQQINQCTVVYPQQGKRGFAKISVDELHSRLNGDIVYYKDQVKTPKNLRGFVQDIGYKVKTDKDHKWWIRV